MEKKWAPKWVLSGFVSPHWANSLEHSSAMKKFWLRVHLSQKRSCEKSSLQKDAVHIPSISPQQSQPATESYPVQFGKQVLKFYSVCHSDASTYLKDRALPGKPVAERQSLSSEELSKGKFNFLQEKMSPPPLVSTKDSKWNLAVSSYKFASKGEIHDLWPKSHIFPRGLFHLWRKRQRYDQKTSSAILVVIKKKNN